MKTIQLSDEMHAALMEISKGLNNQSHRGTAMPYFFQVQTEHQIAVPEGNGNEAWYMDEGTIETEKEIVDTIYDYKCGKMTKKKIKELDSYDKEEILEEAGWRKVYYDYEKRLENAFFTEKACEHHIKINSHNLNKPHSYLSHAFRNPEMETVLTFLCELSGGKIHR